MKPGDAYRWRNSQPVDWRDCEVTGKRRYPSKAAARHAASGTGHRLYVYRCDDCWGRHVAKAEQRR